MSRNEQYVMDVHGNSHPIRMNIDRGTASRIAVMLRARTISYREAEDILHELLTHMIPEEAMHLIQTVHNRIVPHHLERRWRMEREIEQMKYEIYPKYKFKDGELMEIKSKDFIEKDEMEL